MIVYSNTTPFLSLSSIGKLKILPELFSKVFVAESVIEECHRGGMIFVPKLDSLDWIVPVKDSDSKEVPFLLDLDKGEKQTILLAKDNFADKVIIDEKLGRRVAEYLGLSVTGTLGVLAKAKSLGLISSFLEDALSMKQKGIHYNNVLIERIAHQLGEL